MKYIASPVVQEHFFRHLSVDVYSSPTTCEDLSILVRNLSRQIQFLVRTVQAVSQHLPSTETNLASN